MILGNSQLGPLAGSCKSWTSPAENTAVSNVWLWLGSGLVLRPHCIQRGETEVNLSAVDDAAPLVITVA